MTGYFLPMGVWFGGSGGYEGGLSKAVGRLRLPRRRSALSQ